MIGQQISRYKIIERLGAGGMGEVYLAEDGELHRKVALKFLPEHFSKDPAVNTRFKQEAKAAAALNHSNIITIYDIGEHESKPFIAMEYLPGKSLKDLLEKEELSFERIIDIASQICSGLNEAHHQGITHRDIKPDNILIDAKGQIKIADFGLAKSRGQTKVTDTGSTLGTINYMSPEQLRGSGVDQRADIWSLGVMLYEMITSRLPFSGDYKEAISYSILHDTPEPLARYKTGVTEGWQRIIDKALDKDIDTRYQGVSDLLADIRREKKSGSGIVIPVVESKKKSKRYYFIFAFLIVLIAITTLYLILKSPEIPQKPAMATHKQLTRIGNAQKPEISPDGSFMAFVKDNMLMILDLSNNQTLTLLEGSFLGDPRWAPDGSEILISTYNAQSDFRDILIIPRLGGTPRVFKRGVNACWALDGSWIAITQGDIRELHLVKTGTRESKTLPLFDYHTLDHIDWCQTKKQFLLVVTNARQRKELWTIRFDGTGKTKLIESGDLMFTPRWTPNGDAIYYFRNSDPSWDSFDLVKMTVTENTDTTNYEEEILVSGFRVGPYFSLSGDGKKLVYTRNLDYSNLWLAESEDAALKQLTKGFSWMWGPRFSPDGKWIAYSSDNNIFKMALDGGEPVQLTYAGKESYNPAWSQNGEYIAFGGDESGERKVWIMNNDGTNSRKFEKTRLNSSLEVTWSPGEKILYMLDGYQNYSVLDAVSGYEQPLVHNDSVGYMMGAVYSPDGKKVAIHWNRVEYGRIKDPVDSPDKGPYARGLWVISVEDGSQQRVSKLEVFPIGWTPDGKYIYGYNTGELLKVPVDGSEAETIIKLEGAFNGADVSADGKKFIFCLREQNSDAWLIENFDPEVQ